MDLALLDRRSVAGPERPPYRQGKIWVRHPTSDPERREPRRNPYVRGSVQVVHGDLGPGTHGTGLEAHGTEASRQGGVRRGSDRTLGGKREPIGALERSTN